MCRCPAWIGPDTGIAPVPSPTLNPNLSDRTIMATTEKDMTTLVQREYKEGFVTDIDADTLPPGLGEDVVRTISARKEALIPA